MSSLSCGIVGLPNVGKSTLFNALLKKKQAPSENYPFCTIDPNVGVVLVPDPRLTKLAALSKSKQIIYPTVSFVDIAGLVKGASKGEGLGNQFLANIRQTDAILEVVRCFEGSEVIHVAGVVDPIEDIEVIGLELILADLQMVENIVAKLEKQAKGNKELLINIACLKKAKDHLNENQPLRSLSLEEEESAILASYPFLSRKKILYITNVAEEDLPSMENPLVKRVREFAKLENSPTLPICAKLEEELSQLSEEESTEFLDSMGLKETGLTRLITSAYAMLDLITFITTGEQETKAWMIPKGTTAAAAAGKIHSDIEKGFIRAEVISYEDMIQYGGRVKAREMGKARSEGRDYIVQDGDVILFFHN